MGQSVIFVLALALVASPLSVGAQERGEGVSKVPVGIRTQHRLPPRLMLRASYYVYLDMEATNGATYGQTKSNAEEPESAQADDDVASPEPILDESVSSPVPGTEVPDIDTLSQRSIEHYEIHHAAAPAEASRQGGMSRGGKIAVGVVVPLVVAGIVAGAVVMATGFDDIW